MSTARFHPRVFSPRLPALVSLTVMLSLAAPQQSPRTIISITIDPPEATLHVGQVQKFSAVVHLGDSAGIEWTVEEQEAGSITQDGVYTAPRVIGIYHIRAIAISKGIALARAIAKVTVVTEYDTSPQSVATNDLRQNGTGLQ